MRTIPAEPVARDDPSAISGCHFDLGTLHGHKVSFRRVGGNEPGQEGLFLRCERAHALGAQLVHEPANLVTIYLVDFVEVDRLPPVQPAGHGTRSCGCLAFELTTRASDHAQIDPRPGITSEMREVRDAIARAHESAEKCEQRRERNENTRRYWKHAPDID